MRDGDHGQRFEALFERFGPDVLAYAQRRTDAVTADDVTSEVFVVAWRKLDEVPADALPWLLACARRVLANMRRSDRRREALRDRLSAEPLLAAGPALHGDRLLGRALETLNERERELLLLVAWEGLDHGEVAAILDCSRATVSVRLHRARARLARALGDLAGEDPTTPLGVSR